MKQRIVIKLEGRDLEGNTGPIGPDGQRIENFYAVDSVAVDHMQPEGIDELRQPSYDPETGERQYALTLDEAIKQHADKLADGRTYFITHVNNLPEREFRDAWRYDETTTPHSIKLDLDAVKTIHTQLIHGLARIKLSNVLISTAERDAIIEAVKSVDLTGLTDVEQIKETIPDILRP